MPYERNLMVVRGPDMCFGHGEPVLLGQPKALQNFDGTTVYLAAVIDAEGSVIALVPDIEALDRAYCEQRGIEYRLPEIICERLNAAESSMGGAESEDRT